MAGDLSNPNTNAAEEYDQQLANLLTALADEISAGGEVTMQQACLRHPEFAADIRDLWGIMVVTQVAGKETGSSTSLSGDSLFELPFEFGDYTLEEEIGRGGMGVVYRATRQSDELPVAIKMMLKGKFASETDLHRFQVEAEAASHLDHPNIIPIYEIGEQEGRAYFCMKFIEGETLAQRLTRGPLGANEAAEMMVDVAKAIHYAHSKGVLHRDLKPSNILLTDDRCPYVADFGLAKRQTGQVSLTKSGAILGTPSYMSPEQAAGARGEVNETSDVYSLGAILYHSITGSPPFLGASPVDTVLMVLEQDPISPRVLNRRVDRDLEFIAMRCLQKPQDLRYSDAGRLANDLHAFLNDGSISAKQGRFAQVIANFFRETHHADVLENWGLLWMWHSLVLLVACVLTNVLSGLQVDVVTHTILYWSVWLGGFGTWAVVFWLLRRRMGPVTFVERQIAHIWAASMICVGALYPLEMMMGMSPMKLAPVIAVIASMVFLVKAGILSGTFYIHSAACLVTAFVMVMFPKYSMFIFGVVSSACFFFTGLQYYRRRRINLDTRQFAVAQRAMHR